MPEEKERPCKGAGLDVVVDHSIWEPHVPVGGNAGPEQLGQHEVGVRHSDGFVVHLEGSRCAVDLQVTQEMQYEAFEDITQVEVYDDTVWVYGTAIPGHADWEHAAVCAW